MIMWCSKCKKRESTITSDGKKVFHNHFWKVKKFICSTCVMKALAEGYPITFEED
ncbi:hypothetical protein ES703_124777 [subsurface metagenome]